MVTEYIGSNCSVLRTQQGNALRNARVINYSAGILALDAIAGATFQTDRGLFPHSRVLWWVCNGAGSTDLIHELGFLFASENLIGCKYLYLDLPDLLLHRLIPTNLSQAINRNFHPNSLRSDLVARKEGSQRRKTKYRLLCLE
jgi:hypothetical protein